MSWEWIIPARAGRNLFAGVSVRVLAGGLNAVIYIPAAVGVLLLSAFVLMQLWGWFAVSLGARKIGLFHAAGLLALIGVAKAGLSEWRLEAPGVSQIRQTWYRLANITLGVLMCWGIGAVCHLLQGHGA